MKPSSPNAHSSVERSAAVVIQAWIRGHRSRKETSNVWVSYLSVVKECEGEKAETKIKLPLLRHAEVRAKSVQQVEGKGSISRSKERINPYSIYLNQRGQKQKIGRN